MAIASLSDVAVVADCPHCERSETFDDQATARAWLTTHIRKIHPDVLPSEKFECEHCGEAFLKEEALRGHLGNCEERDE